MGPRGCNACRSLSPTDILIFSPCELSAPWGQGSGLLWSLLYLQHQKQHLAPKTHSVNTCGMKCEASWFHTSWPLHLLLLLHFFLFFFFCKFIYLFLAALGLRCCAWAFSSSGERGLLFIAMRGFLIVVASLVAEHGL